MNDSIYFVVPGQPIPKARARVTRSGHAYTPERTAAWESKVAWAARLAMQGREPFAGDVVVAVVIKRGDRKRADTDNCVKSLIDAMDHIVFGDDQQVTGIYAMMIRGHAEPGVTVLVEPASRASSAVSRAA